MESASPSFRRGTKTRARCGPLRSIHVTPPKRLQFTNGFVGEIVAYRPRSFCLQSFRLPTADEKTATTEWRGGHRTPLTGVPTGYKFTGRGCPYP